MPKVVFVNEVMEVEVEAGTTVLEAARKCGIHLQRSSFSCGGRGFPGCSCRVWVRAADGRVSKRTLWERLPLRHLHGELRLACQAEVQGDLRVITVG